MCICNFFFSTTKQKEQDAVNLLQSAIESKQHNELSRAVATAMRLDLRRKYGNLVEQAKVRIPPPLSSCHALSFYVIFINCLAHDHYACIIFIFSL